MPISKKGVQIKKWMYHGVFLPWETLSERIAGQAVSAGQQPVDSVITDPEQIKAILLDVIADKAEIFFKRDGHGSVCHCQMQWERVTPQPSVTGKSLRTDPRETKPDKAAAPLLHLVHVIPDLETQQMRSGQSLTVIFTWQGWYYRTHLQVAYPAATGWVVSYPTQLLKAGRQRGSLRITTTETDTCLRLTHATGESIPDPDLRDVSMGGCSFMVPPEAASLPIGSRVTVHLEWGELEPSHRSLLSVGGIIKSRDRDGLYHVAFTELGEEMERFDLLEALLLFVQEQRLNRHSRKYIHKK